MNDYRVFLEMGFAVVIGIGAWFFNHYLIEKKRLLEQQRVNQEHTAMFAEVAREWHTLTELIDTELAHVKNETTFHADHTREEWCLRSTDQICAREPYQLIVQEKRKACEHNGIVFTEKEIVEKRYLLSGLDMVTVLGNLLDNALESCMALEEKRFIVLEIRQKLNLVEIRVRNSKARGKKSNRRYETTKSNRLLHGYGLKNVDDTVRRHQGSMEIVDKDGVFEVTIQMECEQ